MRTGTAIALRGVHYRYPDGHVALRGVDLDVAAGERVAVLGPNGAGKSTLVLHCNAILQPTAGSVTVCGLDAATADALEVRRRVQLVFQDPDDMLFMPTVREDVAFGPANLGLPPLEIARRVEAALEAVGMQGVADRPPHHLSLGQRRRVSIAAVLAMDPEVLVLDEPSANLDPRARRELGEVLDARAQTILLVTHDLPFAVAHCERAVILDQGRVVADGPTRDLLADTALLEAHALELPEGYAVPR